MGVVDGVPNQLISQTRIEVTAPDSVTEQLDMTPIAPASLNASVYKNGQLVELVHNLPPLLHGTFALGGVSDFSWGFDLLIDSDAGVAWVTLWWDWSNIIPLVFRDDSNHVLMTLGPGDYKVDFVAMFPTHVVSAYTRVDMTASMPDLAITGETLLPPVPLSVPDPSAGGPATAVALSAPYPSPTGGAVTVTYALKEAGHARLELFDLNGRRVATLVDGEVGSGVHRVSSWRVVDGQGHRLQAGVYLLRLQAGRTVMSRRLIVMP
jgi:hypothetical protein